MAIKRKPKKKSELDNFMTMDKEEIEDIKKSTVVEEKEAPQQIETIEKQGDKKKILKLKKKAIQKEKTVKRNKNSKEIVKRGNYELIITEKPQAAAKIADALSSPSGKSNKKTIAGVSYYELERNGKKIFVGCAVGHLFTLKQNNSEKKLPIFDVKWVPNYLARKKDFTKKYYSILDSLAKNASEFTVATDYDTEGEVIGLNIIRFICNQKDANRMKFSTLTSKELQEAYDHKAKTLNWPQGIAGETRHYLDWFYGINLSRALMESIKASGSFKIMSVGRVQGPALNLVVEKEREIQAFKSEKYFQVFITIDKHNLELKYIKDIFDNAKDRPQLEKFKNLEGKEVYVLTSGSEQKIPPGVPFDLTTLQTEAYKFYGFTPARTLQIAQTLYLGGLISYPRTSSQQLPLSLQYHDILTRVAKKFGVEKYITRKTPIEGKKTDPAHPSIYPTGETQELDGDEKKLYDLIARRFLALFCSDAVIYNKKIEAQINDLKFNTRGISIKEKGFMDVYPTVLKEKELPDINGKAKIIKLKNEQKETQPPRRYSPASIVSELEKRNLGTKATRSSIVETLYDRGYIKEKSIEATPLGMSLISTLEKYSPIIIDENLTRQFEKEADGILNSNKDLVAKEEKIINEAKLIITKIISSFDKNNKNIGQELIQANKDLREVEKIANQIMLCPVCGKGQLAITYSRKNRKFFIACNAYPECKTTFSLPPYGTIKKLDKQCQYCSYTLLMSLSKGKSPWIFCFNPNCPSRQKKIETFEPQKKEDSSENQQLHK